MAGEIKRLEIFAAGSWKPGNGKAAWTVSESDLDSIVGAFSDLSGTNIVKPHLKLGHAEAQKWFGQKVGVPTLGWVDRVWREGAKLFADISNVPDALLAMIKGKQYHNVSAEIYPPGVIEHNGKTFGHVLSAIALLGAEMPAVKDLAGLAAALYNEAPPSPEKAPVTYTQGNNIAMFTQEQLDALIEAERHKVRTAVTGEFTAQVADLTTQVAAQTNRAVAAETKLSAQAAAFAEQEGTNLIDAAIKAGKLLPAQRDGALAFMKNMSSVGKFGDGGEPASVQFAKFLGTFGAQVPLGEKGSGKHSQDKGQDAGTFATAAQEVDSRVQEKLKADPTKKLTYSDAMADVLAADDDLKQRYGKGE